MQVLKRDEKSTKNVEKDKKYEKIPSNKQLSKIDKKYKIFTNSVRSGTMPKCIRILVPKGNKKVQKVKKVLANKKCIKNIQKHVIYLISYVLI